MVDFVIKDGKIQEFYNRSAGNMYVVPHWIARGDSLPGTLIVTYQRINSDPGKWFMRVKHNGVN